MSATGCSTCSALHFPHRTHKTRRGLAENLRGVEDQPARVACGRESGQETPYRAVGQRLSRRALEPDLAAACHRDGGLAAVAEGGFALGGFDESDGLAIVHCHWGVISEYHRIRTVPYYSSAMTFGSATR